MIIPDIHIRYDQHHPASQYVWELTRSIVVTLSDGSTLIIPAGFRTDFATIPKIFWSILPPIGKNNIAFIIHDYLYQTRDRRGRKFADDEMKHWMKLTNTKKAETKVVYRVVRWRGRPYWKGKAGKY